ncbi:BppU family phage baseplate upper protein [Staphylococcus xylosus]|uniref:BppU family phage baseplate upper protein n=1 Tax=Staphylococcus xylosus TaxID=1288 RepID=UPI001AAD5120|nr:BppU family phage baseplate upper protein [Staphylococcus xylosus]MBO3073329.1 BppU family phage baseplate upper protein [Staphylococcus xylosus]
MTNGIDKKALFNLKSEPYLKPISDLGVGFYNLDENTAILRFQLSNSKGPLLIHKNNLIAYAYFESSNGSVSDVIELEIEDSNKGIVTITLDSEFLHASTSTSVKGQVYIGVNNVDGKTEYNEVAVFREFTFEVADALINKISSFTKIEYIRMFNQLKMKIEQQVRDIEEAIANGADYVAEMKSVLQQGIETLNAIVASGKSDIQAYITQAKIDLTKVKDDAAEDITTVSNNAKTSVQDTATNAVNNINTISTEATEHVDAKVIEFNQTVEDNGFLSPQILDEELGKLEWQKYKLTNDDGSRTYVQGLNLHEAPPGQYESTQTVNGPLKENGEPDTGFIEADISVSSNGRRLIMATRSSFNKTYVKTLHTNGIDTGWKELTNNQTDTGWIPFTLINGALSNTAYKATTDAGFDCAYRIVVNGTQTKKMVRINGSNISPGQLLFNLPSGFVKTAQTFPVRIPTNYPSGWIVMRPSGETKFYVSGDSSGWVSSDYVYGQIEWTD